MSAWAAEPTRTVDQMIGDYEAQKKQYAQFEQSLAVKNAEIQQLDAKITIADQALKAADQVVDKKSNAYADALKNKVGKAALNELNKELETAREAHEKAEVELKSIQNQRDTAFNQFQQINGEIEKTRLKVNQLADELLTAQFATTKEVEVSVNWVCHEEESLKQCKEKAVEDARKKALEQGVALLVDSFSKMSFQNERWTIDKKEILSEGSGTVLNITWIEPLELSKGAYVGKMKASVQGQIPPSLKQRFQIVKNGETVKVAEKPSGMSGMSGMSGVSKEPKKEFTNSIGMEFVLIPAGSFQMGSENGRNNEKPVHKVEIKEAFYLGKYEVTQKQWQAIMGNNPSHFQGENLPVEKVSCNDAQEFIKKLNDKEGKANKYRLPTEAEWEYAARANTSTKWSFGDDENQLKDYAWCYANSGNKTHAVGQKKPNGFGLFDMHGNVWEWCEDSWEDNYKTPRTQPAPKNANENKNENKLLRDGSWGNNAVSCRSSSRDCYSNSSSKDGFRLMLSAFP